MLWGSLVACLGGDPGEVKPGPEEGPLRPLSDAPREAWLQQVWWQGAPHVEGMEWLDSVAARERYSNDGVGLLFYQTLLSDLSLRFFLGRTYLDKSKLTEALLDEYRLARRQLGQRWISFSFVGGQLHRKFADVAPAVRVPVLALFGKQAESPGPTGRADNATDFAAIRSDFEYQVIDGAGLNVHREKPDVVAERLLAFAK